MLCIRPLPTPDNAFSVWDFSFLALTYPLPCFDTCEEGCSAPSPSCVCRNKWKELNAVWRWHRNGNMHSHKPLLLQGWNDIEGTRGTCGYPSWRQGSFKRIVIAFLSQDSVWYIPSIFIIHEFIIYLISFLRIWLFSVLLAIISSFLVFNLFHFQKVPCYFG